MGASTTSLHASSTSWRCTQRVKVMVSATRHTTSSARVAGTMPRMPRRSLVARRCRLQQQRHQRFRPLLLLLPQRLRCSVSWLSALGAELGTSMTRSRWSCGLLDVSIAWGLAQDMFLGTYLTSDSERHSATMPRRIWYCMPCYCCPVQRGCDDSDAVRCN